jgi:hypothetical protein
VNDAEDSFGDEMFILELDERIEFGAVALSSGFLPDANSACGNAASCSSDNSGICVNGTACHK